MAEPYDLTPIPKKKLKKLQKTVERQGWEPSQRLLQKRQQRPSLIMTHHNHENQKWHPAEELNGRLAMIGIVAALLNYAWTGQIIPGIW